MGKLRKFLFLMMFHIPVFISVVILPSDVYAQPLHLETLEEYRVIEIVKDKDTPQISVDNLPTHIEIVDREIDKDNDEYLAGVPYSDEILNLEGPHKGKIYVANAGSDTVSVIDVNNHTKIADITVGGSFFLILNALIYLPLLPLLYLIPF